MHDVDKHTHSPTNENVEFARHNTQEQTSQTKLVLHPAFFQVCSTCVLLALTNDVVVLVLLAKHIWEVLRRILDHRSSLKRHGVLVGVEAVLNRRRHDQTGDTTSEGLSKPRAQSAVKLVRH